ncbi:N-acetylmuramoyl-L-alanine amidase [Ruminiclostridium cellulolyticum]|uniref:Cell wall hydrolase/autolysin n=1 Tax=Ruminiclostridium cellulolyticum (strain ATCC 35319 / DSM 5812 / JCM 6584 / H10) TaxID=394503 RepID=B8I884_RUMCH|nr:N-acetylmuramoyl-L-alanine amidase [Ruminiclostridium cellulolyticum]ACL77184.1 cell wall hydrolase/autolysin [Ruminiclostridium cellulolyticum H10]
MIVLISKKNILFVVLLLLMSITILSIGLTVNYSKPVTADGNKAPAEGVAPAVRTVILDAGHGGEDPGAVSDYSGLKEKDVNLNIVMLLKRLMEKDNYKVILTRDSDRLVYTTESNNIIQKRREDLTRRKGIMDDSSADLVVSVHLNKFPQAQYHGAQVFFPPKSDTSKKLADEIQNAIRLNVDNANDRVALVKKDPIMILKNLKTTTVIVECGFLSNVDEEKKLAAEDYQNKLASAIKKGIDSYYKKDVHNNPKPNNSVPAE